MRKKIRGKLYLGFAVVLAITVIISAVGLANIRSINESYVYAFSHPMERFNILTQISVRMLDSGGLVPTIVLQSGNTEEINRLTLDTDSNHEQLLYYANAFRYNVYVDSRLNDTETVYLIQLMEQTEELFIQFKEKVIDPIVAAAHIGDMPTIDTALALDAQLRAQIYERHMEMVAEAEETLANVRLDAENATNIVTWTLIVFAVAGIVLGLIVAVFTSGFLGNAMGKENEAKLRQQQIYDANPVPASLWNENQQIIACNNAMVRLLGMTDKDDYTERFFEFTPEFQQDGTRTTDKVAEISGETNKTGYCRTAFAHLSAEKEIVPCDVIAVKIELDSETLHAVYAQDLRPALEADAKLQEANKLNEILVENSPFIMNIWDESANIVTSSPQAAKICGVGSEEEFIERFFELAPEIQPCGTPSREMAAMRIAQAFSEGSARFEWMHQKLDGEPIPVEAILQRFTRNDKPYVVSFAIDRRLSVAIQQKESAEAEWKKLRTLFDSAPFGCAIHGTDYRLLDANNKVTNLLEISDKQEYINAPFNFYPETQSDGSTSKAKTAQLITQVLKEGSAVCEWLYRTKNGKLIPCEVTLVRTTVGNEDVIVAWLRDLRDFYEYKEMSERIQLMINATPLMIEFWDENYLPIDCNKATLDFFGLSKGQYEQYLEEIRFNPPIPGNIGDSHRNGWNANVKKIFEAGHGRFDWAEPKPDGTAVPLEVEGSRMTFNNEPVVITYSRDVTELRILQKEQADLLSKLEAAVESEKAANLAKSKFLSNMSHEIRTPMSAIIGMAGIAKSTDDTKRKDESILKIDKASKHLLGIINQILDMSKIEAENFELDSRSFLFEKMVGEVVSILSVKVDEKRLSLDVVLDKTIPRFVVSDELRLAQVITNLLTNAVKFTPEEGNVSLTATLETNTGKEMNLRVEVTDTGIGIPKEHHATLFDAFTQADSGTTRNFGGTGLGLSISKWIVEKMGGNIRVESEPNEGSKFTFIIPIAEGDETDDETAFSTEVPDDIPPNLFSGYTVLIAEDVDVNREIMSALLEPVGIEIECAEDGSQALQMFRDASEHYDMIFMDVQMPVMDGITATRLIREIGTEKAKNIPIVAMTANVFSEDVKSCLEAGMNDHLSKPLDFNQIMTRLKQYLRK